MSAEGTDDVEGQSGRWSGLGQADHDVEGQVYMMSVHRKGDTDDTRGHALSYGLEPVPYRQALEPAESDDAQGQAWRYGVEPGTADDAVGHANRLGLHPTDPEEIEGQRYKRGSLVPADDGTWTLQLDEGRCEGRGSS